METGFLFALIVISAPFWGNLLIDFILSFINDDDQQS